MVTRPIHNPLEDLTINSRILGLNVTGSKTIAVYGDMNGLIYERMQMETPSDVSFLECFDAICTLADKLLKLSRSQRLSSPEVISVAVSGPVDRLRGEVLSPPDLLHWDAAQLKGRLTVRYNLPVFIEHRSQAAALAEYTFGAGVGFGEMIENLVLVDMEPVVGAGLVLGESVYHGANDAAGDIGRIRMAVDGPAGFGEPGSLTGFASGVGMAELASQRFPERWPAPPWPYDLVKAIKAGEAEALAVAAEAAEHLGRALVWLTALLDPDMIVFGHPGDLMGEALLGPLRESVLRHGGGEARQLPRLIPSKLGAKLDDVAALMGVINAFKTRETR
jgi:glucokinase